MTDPAMQKIRQFQAQADEARESAVKSARIGATAFGALCIAGAVASVVAAILGYAPLPAAAVCVAMGGGFGAMLLRHAAKMRRPEELAQTGLAAVAIFEEVTGGGVSIQVSNSQMRGNVMQTRVRMKIEAPGAAPYSVEVTDFLPGGAHGRLVAGARFGAFVDHANPQRVLVDWNAIK